MEAVQLPKLGPFSPDLWASKDLALPAQGVDIYFPQIIIMLNNKDAQLSRMRGTAPLVTIATQSLGMSGQLLSATYQCPHDPLPSSPNGFDVAGDSLGLARHSICDGGGKRWVALRGEQWAYFYNNKT